MKEAVGFDPIAGTLRVTREVLGEMCALHAGERGPGQADLAGTGILQGEALHPRLVPVVDTAARPLVRLSVDVAAKTSVHCDGCVGATFALLLAGRSATQHVLDATFMSRSMLTAQLARFVRLGPRTRAKVSDAVEIDRGLLEALLGGGEGFSPSQVEVLVDPQDQIDPPWIETLSILSTGASSRWRMGAWWNSFEESPEARMLEILDSEVGLFLVSHVARGSHRFARLQLRPVTPTQVWRLLCGLIPRPHEVAEPLRP